MACVKKGGKGISHPRGPPMGGFLTHGLCQEGWERDFPPTGATTHGVCQEGWERDFPPTGCHPWGDFSPTACVKKGGKGISHPRGPPMGGFPPTACVKKGGKGISHPRGPPMGGFPIHRPGVLIVVCSACCCRAVRSCHRVRLCGHGCGGC